MILHNSEEIRHVPLQTANVESRQRLVIRDESGKPDLGVKALQNRRADAARVGKRGRAQHARPRRQVELCQGYGRILRRSEHGGHKRKEDVLKRGLVEHGHVGLPKSPRAIRTVGIGKRNVELTLGAGSESFVKSRWSYCWGRWSTRAPGTCCLPAGQTSYCRAASFQSSHSGRWR